MATKHYPEIEANPNFPALEEIILRFWQSARCFEQSVAHRPVTKRDGSNNAYVFYDGPPFANGLPHYGHLLTGYVKDAIARYHTMKGARVERRFGWDCHGLPAEMGAEKELGISGRAAIAHYGIGRFNEHCRTSVMKYTQDWEYYVTRQGRWVDFQNDYKTMDKDFMESVLWAFKQLHDKGLIYESMRVMPYSWAAETPVSNFETRIDNATRPREDKAAYVKFRLKEKPKGAPEAKDYYLIAWTTTPWTLPSNLALAVNKEMSYRYYMQGEECWAVANSVIPAKAGIHLTDEQMDSSFRWNDVKGEVLIGLTYEPLFPYFADTPNAFRVLDGSAFVTEGDGTGIVHMAPGFGEVDYQACVDAGIEVVVPVDEKGRFTSEIYDIPWDSTPRERGMVLSLQGLTVVPDTRIFADQITVSDEDRAQHISEKDVAKYGLANMRIVRWLKANRSLVKDEAYTHNYPHCWRTDTPLIYRAMGSWYVAINTAVPALGGKSVKEVMAANNQTIHWIPDHVRDGQMGKGIESAPDWSISRNRFWGTPIPIWKSASGKIHVCGSIEEIEQLSGQTVTDLHRPYIDDIVLKIDGETYTRIEDVFDCWFESGSMPFAQLHYPFENKQTFEKNFPADFITEYIAQTRGWFYTLQVLSAALFTDAPFLKAKGVEHSAPFKNVICHGVVIDEETGLKYSKRLKNYKDPKEVMDAYGADALRWMMLSSPVMRGADLAVDPDGKFIRDVVRLNIKPIWSAFNFFTLYANADGVRANLVTGDMCQVTSQNHSAPVTRHLSPVTNLLDRYILAKCKAAVTQAEASLDAYDTPGATEAITAFFEVLNNWYIRRSRPRFWGEAMTEDKQAAYDMLFTVLNLMCIAAAPLLPFTTEAIYRGLNGFSSPARGGSNLQEQVRGGGANLAYGHPPESAKADLTPREQGVGEEAVSVHLQDFPDVSAIANEAELVADMDWVQAICNAASAIRSKQNIRTRQPLAALNIYGEWRGARQAFETNDWNQFNAHWAPLRKIIEEENNVKTVHSFPMPEDFEKVASRKLVINSQALGKHMPEKMKQILPASKKGEWDYNDQGGISIAGVTLNAADGFYSIVLEPKPEYKDSAQTSGDNVVVLDLRITPELEAEGRARDLVRMIQQARKDAGLNVADRITLGLDVPAEFRSVLEDPAHRNFIAAQTLATSLSEGSAGADQRLTQELDGAQFVIGISKAA